MHPQSLSAIDLNLLVVLRALLGERHVTRAAKRVGLSQSATSHALARLRELYQDPLLVRSGRFLQLTPRALQLLPLLERGLGELESTVSREPPFEPSQARRAFTIGMADYGQALLVGPLLRAISSAAPYVDLSIVSFPNLSELLESGGIDLAVLVTGTASHAFPSQKLFSDGFLCMVARNHSEIKSKLGLETYLRARHVLIAPTGQAGSFVDSELGRRGLERRIALRVSSFLAAPLVVADSDLVSTAPERLARAMAKRYPIRLLPPPLRIPRFELAQVWHPRWDNDPAHRWLRQIVASVSEKV
ncbi:MAG TPA: LysR family transcriptional regulator [Polyangiaceae bacterium]|jgi:DNA-binding transcriptional LysR family regulator